MDQRIKVGIDHCSVFNQKLEYSANLFFALGFVGDGNAQALSEEAASAFVPSTRFVADNAYIECVCFPPEVEEFYHYLKSRAAVHLMTMLTPNAEDFCSALRDHGEPVPEITVTTRENACHGPKTGTARFLLVPIGAPVVPDTHLAYLQHCSRELIYQSGRWQHRNDVRTLDEVTLCCEEAQAGAMMDRLTELDRLANSGACEGGLRSMRFLDPDSFTAEFGARPDPNRSLYAAFTFGVGQLDSMRSILEGSNFRWHEAGGRIYVNVLEEIGLFLVFQTEKAA